MSLRFNFMSQIYGIFMRLRRIMSLVILIMDNKKGKDRFTRKKKDVHIIVMSSQEAFSLPVYCKFKIKFTI